MIKEQQLTLIMLFVKGGLIVEVTAQLDYNKLLCSCTIQKHGCTKGYG